MPVSGKKSSNQAMANSRNIAGKNKLAMQPKAAVVSSASFSPVKGKCKKMVKPSADQHSEIYSPNCTSKPLIDVNSKHGKQPATKSSLSSEIKQSKKGQLLKSLVAVMNGTLSKTDDIGSSNPLGYTTSVARDAALFPFLCQSCATVRYEKYWDLRLHEDWCGRASVGSVNGVICSTCFRRYRNTLVLNRHVSESHRPGESDVKTADGVEIGLHIARMTEANTLNYSTVCAPDATQFPHICASCCMVCFSDIDLLQQHEDWCGQSSGSAGFACPKCLVSFRANELLQRHQRHCNKTSKSTLENKPHQPDIVCTQDDFSDTSCPICSVQLCSRLEQLSHLRTVHSLDDRSTSNVETLAAPIQYSRQYMRCSKCGMRFTVYKHLEQHMERCSRTSRPNDSRVAASVQWRQRNVIHCGDCGEPFSSRLLLNQHKRHCNEESHSTVSVRPSQSSEKIKVLDTKESSDKGQASNKPSLTMQSSTDDHAAVKKYPAKHSEQQPANINGSQQCSIPVTDTSAKLRQENSKRKRVCNSTISSCLAKKAKSEDSVASKSSATKSHSLVSEQQKGSAEVKLLQNERVADVDNEAGAIVEQTSMQNLKNNLVSNDSKCAIVASKSVSSVKVSKEAQSIIANKCKHVEETAKQPQSCRKSGRRSAVEDVGNNKKDVDCSPPTRPSKDSLRTVEVVDRNNVKCAKCGVNLRTVRQIADHVCL